MINNNNNDFAFYMHQFKQFDFEYKNRPCSFSKTIKFLMIQRGMKNADLADILGVVPSYISNLVNEDPTEEKKHSTKVIVAICIILQLSPYMSLYLLKLAGCTIMNNHKDRCFLFLLCYCYTMSLEECDELLYELCGERFYKL